MMQMRDLNMETSLRVFCGSYISEAEEFAISDKYWLITLALQLVNFPFAIPGTKVYNAIQARKIAMNILMSVAAKSKVAMAEGGEVTCLVDAWIKEMIDARLGQGDQNEEDRKVLIREYSDKEIAMVVLSFLFASQDAMTSAIVRPLRPTFSCCLLLPTYPLTPPHYFTSFLLLRSTPLSSSPTTPRSWPRSERSSTASETTTSTLPSPSTCSTR